MSSEIFKIYKYVYESRKHILEMLEDRGYDVNHLKNYTEEEIKLMLSEQESGKFGKLSEIGPLDIFIIKNKDTTMEEKLYVKYRLDYKFKGTVSLTSQINEIFESLLNTKDTLIILNICRVLMKPGVKETGSSTDFINEFNSKNYFVQLFGLENFLLNVSKHQFVPKFRILSKQEAQTVLTKFNCNVKNIPTIKKDDAQAKYIGLRPKQICEIKADNITSGYTIKYRLCVLN